MQGRDDLAAFYRAYGAQSFSADEPAYARICEGVAGSAELLDLLLAHRPAAHQPNLLLAAVHYLLLGGLEHRLGAVYFAGATDDPAPLFEDVVLSNRERIDELLATRSTQTNEVGRCTVLAPMLQRLGLRTDRPLGWIDLGASAGLNLGIDQFQLIYDEDAASPTTIGAGGAPLQLAATTSGVGPELAPDHASIAWRVGVDRSPIDITDPDQARWLHACLWPSAVDRGARLAAAIEVAQASPSRMIEADAVDGLAQALAEMPPDLTPVVTTSWVWYYLPAATRESLLATMRQSDRRVHWASLEGTGVVELFGEPMDEHAVRSSFGVIGLGAGLPDEIDLVGQCHPHGTWIEWF